MVKKLLTLLFSSALVFSLSTPVRAQEAKPKTEKAKAPEPARWEGVVTVKGKTTLTVRQVGSTGVDKTIEFDSSTKWVSQEHGSKKVNNIDASQVKEGDRVICVGTVGKDGVFRASTISKRLTTGISQ